MSFNGIHHDHAVARFLNIGSDERGDPILSLLDYRRRVGTGRSGCRQDQAQGCFHPRHQAEAVLRGRPPLRPFSREAAILAAVRALPPSAPSWRAIHRFDPNTPCSSPGT